MHKAPNKRQPPYSLLSDPSGGSHDNVHHRSALLIVDPYNDFMSEGGKFYEAARKTANAAGEFHPEFGPGDGDVVALERWGQSGFANTGFEVSKIWRLPGTSTSFSNRTSASDEMR